VKPRVASQHLDTCSWKVWRKSIRVKWQKWCIVHVTKNNASATHFFVLSPKPIARFRWKRTRLSLFADNYDSSCCSNRQKLKPYSVGVAVAHGNKSVFHSSQYSSAARGFKRVQGKSVTVHFNAKFNTRCSKTNVRRLKCNARILVFITQVLQNRQQRTQIPESSVITYRVGQKGRTINSAKRWPKTVKFAKISSLTVAINLSGIKRLWGIGRLLYM